MRSLASATRPGAEGPMLAFDWAAGGLLPASAAVWLARGAHRGDPPFHPLTHPAGLASPAGMAVVFLAAYIVLRLIGGFLTRGVRESGLSGLDRVLGLTLGLGRGLVALGAFALLLGAFVPAKQ